MSRDPEDGRSVERDESETQTRLVGRRVHRRSFLGGLAVVGATGLVGRGAAQQDGQEEQPGWLRAREATARIEVFGDYNFPGIAGEGVVGEGGFHGSGAVVDESGIALTNAHVVAGADTLQVYLGEDQQRSYNAEIRGVSDCADLAVIDVQGEGFPSLDWRQDSIGSGLEVAAHGFPVHGENVATTRGIVSRLGAEGETEWTSVDSVIEHTANIAPGNSGGPLVDNDGNLVGVNYGAALTQFFAVGLDVAQPIIQRLRNGEDIHYLGMSTEAVETQFPMTPEGLTRALHVVTVDPGTPAWNAGIRAGDRVTRIRGTRAVSPETPLPTKEFYCDVLRTQGTDAVYPVQVVRPLPGEQSGGMLFEGEINGEPLQPVETQQVEETATEYTEYQQVADDTGTIATEVPAEWDEVDGSPGTLGPFLTAAPDLDSFYNTWATPGVIIIVTDQFGTDTDAALDFALLNGCQNGPREEFTGAGLTGQSQRLSDCDATGTDFVNIAALPEDESYMVLVGTQVVSDRDERALSRIVESLQITGDPAEVGPDEEPEPEEPPEDGEPEEGQPPEDGEGEEQPDGDTPPENGDDGQNRIGFRALVDR